MRLACPAAGTRLCNWAGLRCAAAAQRKTAACAATPSRFKLIASPVAMAHGEGGGTPNLPRPTLRSSWPVGRARGTARLNQSLT